MDKTFTHTICKNIDQIGEAARRGNQDYVDQHLDNLFAFNERLNGRSGLALRWHNAADLPRDQQSLFGMAAE